MNFDNLEEAPLRYSLPCAGDMCGNKVAWCEGDPETEPLLCDACRMSGNYPADWDDLSLREEDAPYEEEQ